MQPIIQFNHFNRIIAPILHCEIDGKMNEQSLNRFTPKDHLKSFPDISKSHKTAAVTLRFFYSINCQKHQND